MAYKMENISVLVVEDNLPMLNLTKSILQTFGVKTIYGAQDGEEGFKKFMEKRPDLVIADWMMDNADGLELTHKIRRDGFSPNQYVPIVLMTGFSEKQRVLAARDAGITEFLVKPFTAHDLYLRISQIIERPRPFIQSEDFFGPDRRRIKKKYYMGPYRRKVDEEEGNRSLADIDIEMVERKP